MSIQFNDVLAFAKNNQLMLGLIASAIIGTMPEKLPGFSAFPQWAWTWAREASKTFLNFKHVPITDEPPIVTTESSSSTHKVAVAVTALEEPKIKEQNIEEKPKPQLLNE